MNILPGCPFERNEIAALYSSSITITQPALALTASHYPSPSTPMAATHNSIIDWPFTTSTPTAPEPKDLRATHPKAPYQPHNGYEQERLNRKRLITTLICLAIALLSDIVAITLYALVGEKEHRGEWLFRTWVVVSVGVGVMLALLAVAFWRNYVKARRSEDNDCDKSTPLKAIGRKGKLRVLACC